MNYNIYEIRYAKNKFLGTSYETAYIEAQRIEQAVDIFKDTHDFARVVYIYRVTQEYEEYVDKLNKEVK